ncbi:tetratricopeptide repeat protein [Rohdeia mirabilis]
MSDSKWIVEGSAANFMQVAIEASHAAPVLVDFWATWCGPCKALGPILEKLAIEFDGAFTLVKIDTDVEQQLAASLGIQSLPTCKLVIGGQLVDEFSGALPEAELRRFLAHHGIGAGPVEDVALTSAKRALEQGDLDGAERCLREGAARLAGETGPSAAESAGDVGLMLSAVVAERGDTAGALAILDELAPSVQESERGRALRAKLHLGAERADDSELAALVAAVEAAPDDLAARVTLGRALAAAGRHAEALRMLMDTIHVDRTFGEGSARVAMLEVFDALGADSDLVHEYRRELQTALFV